jgi:hypothetical protein
MNTRFESEPEVIGTVQTISNRGREAYYGDKIVGISVDRSEGQGLVTIDLRQLGATKPVDNLMIKIELPELVAAISQATLNSRPA